MSLCLELWLTPSSCGSYDEHGGHCSLCFASRFLQLPPGALLPWWAMKPSMDRLVADVSISRACEVKFSTLAQAPSVKKTKTSEGTMKNQESQGFWPRTENVSISSDEKRIALYNWLVKLFGSFGLWSEGYPFIRARRIREFRNGHLGNFGSALMDFFLFFIHVF